MLKLLRRCLYGIAGLLALGAALLSLGWWQAMHRESGAGSTQAPPSGRFIEALGLRLHIQEQGRADAPAVLLVHGTGAWSETWRETMAALADHGYRAIAIDLPPFGYSQRPDSRRYDRRSQGERIAAMLRVLNLDSVVLVGHSFGAGPTVEAALIAPDRVRALILVDAALGVKAEHVVAGTVLPHNNSPVALALRLRPVRNAIVGSFVTNPRFTRRILQSFIALKERATPERVAVYQAPLSLSGTTDAYGDWLPELVAPTISSASEDPQSYRLMARPVGLIWGSLDSITPLEQGRAIAALVPDSHLHVLDGVGHIPQIEAPTAFNELLLTVLREIAPTD